MPRPPAAADDDQKSIPPAPGIGAGAAAFGFSATIASVVINSDATDAASCKAVRTTLVGSMIPLASMSPYSPLLPLLVAA